MLVIREEQVDVLQRYTVDSFKSRLLRYLKAVLPQRGVVMAEHQIRRQIDAGVEQAPVYAFRTEREVAFLVEFFCTHLGGFSEFLPPKQVRKILYANRLTPEEKISALEQWAAAHVGE